jgi:predicted dinucleotide-binding enzyme
MKNVIVLIGAGSIGQAIARRIGAGKQILLGACLSNSPKRE